MESSSLLSHKKMYLDRKVWLVLLTTILLCLGLMSYRLISKSSCIPFVISAQNLARRDSVFKTNETITFKISSPLVKEILWKFGDNTNPERSATTNRLHKFAMEGYFTVKAIVDGRCSNEIKVKVIKNQEAEVQPLDGKVPKISGNLSPLTGEKEQYVTNVVGHSYEWKILDKATFTTITNQDAFFTFPKPGLYTLQLTIDHDRRSRAVAEINVSEALPLQKKPTSTSIDNQNKVVAEAVARAIKNRNAKMLEEKARAEKVPEEPVEKPVEKPSEKPLEKPIEKPAEKPTEVRVDPNVTPALPKPKVRYTPDEIFKTYLEAVVTGEKNAADCDKYLIDRGNTKVRLNGKEFKTFSEFCEQIKGKKITIKAVALKRDPFDRTIVKQIDVEFGHRLW